MQATLKDAVLEQLGMTAGSLTEEDIEALEDIRAYGLAFGVPGFITYSETVRFFDENEASILALASVQAGRANQTMCELIARLGSTNCPGIEVEQFLLFGNDENGTELKNALAWFAAETVIGELGAEYR